MFRRFELSNHGCCDSMRVGDDGEHKGKSSRNRMLVGRQEGRQQGRQAHGGQSRKIPSQRPEEPFDKQSRIILAQDHCYARIENPSQQTCFGNNKDQNCLTPSHTIVIAHYNTFVITLLVVSGAHRTIKTFKSYAFSLHIHFVLARTCRALTISTLDGPEVLLSTMALTVMTIC